MAPKSEKLLAQAWQVRELDPVESLSLLDGLANLTDPDGLIAAKINVVKSFHFSRVFRFRKTLTACTEALEVLGGQGELPWLARLYGRLAIGFHALGDFANAERHYLLQIETASRCEPEIQREELFFAYHNLAHHFFKIGNYTRAHQNYKKAYEFTGPDEYRYGFLQVNHAQVLIKKQEYKVATTKVNVAMEIGRSMNVPRICHYGLPVLAQLAAISNDQKKAEKLYLTALSFAKGHALPLYEVYVQLAEHYLRTDNLCQARDTINLAAEANSGSDDRIHATRLLEIKSEIYELSQDYEQALIYHKAFHDLKMELFSAQKDDNNYAQNIARRIDVLEKEYARLQSHNQELQQRVVHISELRDKAKKSSVTDSLTGLFNRRHLNSEASLIVSAASELNQFVSVAVVDVDLFKQVNDQHGHQVGDEVLRELAGIMRRCMRGSDLLVRYGGEEFVIVMPNTRHEHALGALNRLRDLVKTFDWGVVKPGLSTTVSSGLACALAPSDFKELFELADKRLYLAKNSGRDRVVSDDLPTAAGSAVFND